MESTLAHREGDPRADASSLAEDKETLARALRALGELQAAEGRFLAAYEHVRDMPEGEATRRRVAGHLADLYDEWNAAEPGKGHDAKATTWRERR
jgi:hypothetical protein